MKTNRQKTAEAFRAVAAVCLLCVALASASCADKAVAEPENPQSADGAIGFGVREAKTRADQVTLADMDDIGIYGYFTGYERWGWMSVNNAAALQADYFCNTRLEQAESWTYSPLRYWPMEPAKRLSFFAYSPHTATVDGNGDPAAVTTPHVPYPAVASETGVPVIDYTVPANIRDQIDLLWATVQDKNIESPLVDFSMKHALCALAFSVKFANGTEIVRGYSVNVTGITVSGVYGSAVLDLGTGVWAFDTIIPPADEYVLKNADLNQVKPTLPTGKGNSFNCLDDDAGMLMLIPQDLSNGVLTVELEFIATDSSVTPNTASFELADYYRKWEAGKTYHYELLVNGDFVTIETSAEPWTDGGAINGNVIP